MQARIQTAHILEWQTQIDTLHAEMETLGSEISPLNHEITTLDSEIATINHEIDAIYAQRQSFENLVKINNRFSIK